MSSRRCKDCPTKGYCYRCRIKNRAQTRASRQRRGVTKSMTKCYLCLLEHPRGLRNCPLAAEYEPLPDLV